MDVNPALSLWTTHRRWAWAVDHKGAKEGGREPHSMQWRFTGHSLRGSGTGIDDATTRSPFKVQHEVAAQTIVAIGAGQRRLAHDGCCSCGVGACHMAWRHIA